MTTTKSVKINCGNTIQDYAIKHSILNHIYTTTSITHYNEIISDVELNYLKNNKYSVTPNYEGTGYLLCFITIKESKYCVLVNRKSLITKYEDINAVDADIISIKLRVADNTYNGTIFDGKLIKFDGVTTYIIFDQYMLNGDVLNMGLLNRIKQADSFVKDIKIDKNMSPIDLKITRLHKYDELNELIGKIKASKYDINGLIFIPDCEKEMQLYIYTNKKPIKDTNIYAIFEIHKTNTPDVFELYIKSEGKYTKYGIAYIPTIQDSHYCKKLFMDKNKLVMRCKYSHKFGKWTPLDETTDMVDTDTAIKMKLQHYVK
ncbi:MAG: hypothetical protein Faunusvirus6_13 [Faunusvirus sp.]|jgi:hypothetical protein|uniref:Uncharacterized protein n=1 Tax=Faunusvirus sp. TaxID=2487766 RepID=A0A3G4ZWH7_9VIRU|nr:MAG: hypothetical protein Faunusvirus6_13 [Faunusvirus sp.]